MLPDSPCHAGGGSSWFVRAARRAPAHREKVDDPSVRAARRAGQGAAGHRSAYRGPHLYRNVTVTGGARLTTSDVLRVEGALDTTGGGTLGAPRLERPCADELRHRRRPPLAPAAPS
ncbi:MAG: hypothetical protein FJ125_02565 [Deltaproteobacteria bacterium]|nr:hypothetical protein [Deltaproteobacteria bacterium]